MKGFSQNKEDLAISLHHDCHDLEHPIWSYSALDFGRRFSKYFYTFNFKYDFIISMHGTNGTYMNIKNII